MIRPNFRARLFLACTLWGAASVATAQTTAAGPYYATPSWDQTLPAASRFVLLSNFSNYAVLDRETGLVWMKIFGGLAVSYLQAQEICSGSVVGGRAGWRLPTIAELTSLDDLSAGYGQLPPSPFIAEGGMSYFWSNTSTGMDRILIWTFAGGLFSGSSDGTTAGLPTAARYVCVRGGSQAGS